MELQAKDKALKIAQALDSKKALDIKVLEVGALTGIADYFIICYGTSTTHIKALSNEVDEQIGKTGELPMHLEGYDSASWILMDYGNVLVNIFSKEAMDFYDLERLWSDAPKIDLSDIIKI